MAKRKIFLVDDEKEILDVYQAILAAHFEVTCFDTPQAMVQAIEAGERPEVFVTDMRMPGMSGVQLIKWAREYGIEHPFIIVSGYAERSEAFEVLKLGMIELLEKPFSMDLFRLMVQRAMSYRLNQEFRNKTAVCAPHFDQFLKDCQNGVAAQPEILTGLRADLAQLRSIADEIDETSNLFKI